MSPVTLPASITPRAITPRVHFGNEEQPTAGAGKFPTPSNPDPLDPLNPLPTISPEGGEAPGKKDASGIPSDKAAAQTPPRNWPWKRFQDWWNRKAKPKQQADQTQGQQPKTMALWKKGVIGASLVGVGILGTKAWDAGSHELGKKTDPTHLVDSHGDPHHPTAISGGTTNDPHHPVTSDHVGTGHGVPTTGSTLAPASAAALRPIEGKILSFYFQSAELCEKAFSTNRTKLIAGIRENSKQFEPPLGLDDITRVENGLKSAKASMAASGVTYDLVTHNTAPPTAAQAKAFRDYIVAAQKARILLEQATPYMLFLPSGITTAPYPAAQLHQDLAGLIESSGFENAYMELLGKLGRGTADYQSPWGLTLENMAQDIKRNPWP